jgi:hypothetical protein
MDATTPGRPADSCSPTRDATAGGVVAIAVQGAVDEVLEAGEDRRDDQGDEHGDRRGPSDLGRDERVEQRDQRGIGADGNQGQQRPGQCSRHDQPDVEQLVAHDRDLRRTPG